MSVASCCRLWFAGMLLLCPVAVQAAEPATKPASSERISDVRFQPLKDYDGYFPWTPPTSKEAWAQRAPIVRRQVLVAQGLWPLPTKTPLNAVV